MTSAFDPRIVAESLHQSMVGAGTDDMALISTISSMNPSEVSATYSSFAATYGTTLNEYADSETSGNYGKLLGLVVLPRDLLIAKLVRHAVKGMGTHNTLLIDIAATILPEEATHAEKAYERRYGHSMVTAVVKDTSGDFRRLLKLIFQGVRASEAMPVSVATVGKDTQALIELQANRARLEDFLVEFLGHRSRAHIAAVALEFRSRVGSSLDKALKSELRGNMSRLCRAVLLSSRFVTRRGVAPVAHACAAIRDSIVGMGTNDARLVLNTALIAPYRALLPTAYQILTKANLNKDICGDTSGNYEKLLLAMLGAEDKRNPIGVAAPSLLPAVLF